MVFHPRLANQVRRDVAACRRAVGDGADVPEGLVGAFFGQDAEVRGRHDVVDHDNLLRTLSGRREA